MRFTVVTINDDGETFRYQGFITDANHKYVWIGEEAAIATMIPWCKVLTLIRREPA
jgi:hypothetical protein